MTSWLDVLVAAIAATSVVAAGYFGARASGWLPGKKKPTSAPKTENASDPVIYALQQAKEAAIRAETAAHKLHDRIAALTGERDALVERLRDVAADAEEWKSRLVRVEVDRDEALAHASQLQAEVRRLQRRVSELTHPSSNRSLS